MKNYSSLLATAGLLALVVTPAVFAAKADGPKATKATLMAKYDTNKNGKLDADELAQIKSDFLADPKGDLKRLDTDHDGKLSDEELATLNGKAKGEKKAGAKKKKDL
jgi:Ca2+-binding EF-hand superfamily protein